jgi:uncharacterized protein (TIGR01777 family)
MSNMNVMIAGGTGFIGSALSRSLLADGHAVFVLTRNPPVARLPHGAQAIGWDGRTYDGWLEIFSRMDAVVNLVGATIGQPFWTAQRKNILLHSRVDAGIAISNAFQKTSKKPGVLIQASGIGYYGPHEKKPLAEDAPSGDDFLALLAANWEASTKIVDSLGVRRVIIRSGIVLGNKGVLPLMALPVRMFAGGPLGSGEQGISWIHINDEVRAIRFLIENEKARGVYNLVAPNPTSNADFIRYMAKALNRPYWLRTPAVAFRILLGEMSTLLLEGQFAIPQRLVNLGFDFEFASSFDAFQDLL